MKVIIAGAEIGGLVATTALPAGARLQRGRGCRPEAVSELRPLGVAINIQAGAVRILVGPRGWSRPYTRDRRPRPRRLRYTANRHSQADLGRSARPPCRPAGDPQFSIRHPASSEWAILFDAAQARCSWRSSRIPFGLRRISASSREGCEGRSPASPIVTAPSSRAARPTILTVGADGIRTPPCARLLSRRGPPSGRAS